MSIEDEIFTATTPLRKSMYEEGTMEISCGLCGEGINTNSFYISSLVNEDEDVFIEANPSIMICKECWLSLPND